MAETKLSTAQLGGNEAVYTESTLIGNKEISIIPEPVEGIDEYTLRCFHFNGDAKDAVSGTYSISVSTQTNYTKFGSGASSSIPDKTYIYPTGTSGSYPLQQDWTMDCWIYRTSTGNSTGDFGMGTCYTYFDQGQFNGVGIWYRIHEGNIRVYMPGHNYNISHTITAQAWHHFALMRKGSHLIFYIDGDLVFDKDGITSNSQTYFGAGSRSVYVDDLRISSIARPLTDEGKFPVPSKEYAPVDPTGRYFVKFDSSTFATKAEVATKQDILVAGTNISIAADGKTISATDTTYSAFTGTDGSAAGTAGLVPAPATTDASKFLKADGTWAEAGGSSVTVDQTYDATSTHAQSGTAVAQAVAGVHVPNFTRTWYKNNTGNTIQIVNTSSALSVAIYRNGALLEPTDDYTISGTTLTLVDALTASEKITVEVYQ